uniref:Uncharacterized protein n=1 Tax=Oryza brachyantha TaxID=4533 RepID=J3MFM7_ORYBR
MMNQMTLSSIVVRPVIVAARGPSRLPPTLHLRRCTGGPPQYRLTSNLPNTAAPPCACATAIASPWLDHDDVTEISIYEVIAWSAEEAMELIKKIPPPAAAHDVGTLPPPSLPAPAHDVGKLLRKYERLLHRAEARSIDMFAGSKRLVRCHLMAWEAYEAMRPALLGVGHMTAGEALCECIRRGDVNDGSRDIEPRLLAAFGVRPESLPADLMERHFVAGAMYAAMETRSCAWRRARRLKRVERRNRRREEGDEERRKREEEEEDQNPPPQGDRRRLRETPSLA